MNLPDNIDRLIKVFERGAYGWVGAGLSIAAGYPSLGKLAGDLREKSLSPIDESLEDYAVVDDFLKHNTKGDLEQVLSDIFTPCQHKLYHELLVALPWKGLVTPNYDELLEGALKAVGKPYHKVVLEQNLNLTSEHIPLYKIHGSVENFRTLILSGESYAAYADQYGHILGEFGRLMRRNPIVFWGCSMTDPRLLDWLRNLPDEGREHLRASFAVLTEDAWQGVPAEDRALLTESQIEPVFVQNHNDIPTLITHLNRELVSPTPQTLHVNVAFTDEKRDNWTITFGDQTHQVEVPWKHNNDFGIAFQTFQEHTRETLIDQKEQNELHAAAALLGDRLGQAVFLEDLVRTIQNASGSGKRPFVILESDDNLILSLPWELLRLDGQYTLRDGLIDFARSTPARSEDPPILTEPTEYFRLVVNISAPELSSDHQLDYEGESYRLVQALYNHADVKFTELGTVQDLINTVGEHKPIGIHFSGHGEPGALLFEDTEGQPDSVVIGDLIRDIRPHLPHFFYLASCHGNTPAKPQEDTTGSTISAAQLHREGVTQVVGYFGPVLDRLSTLAEETLYRAIANGHSTPEAIHQTRNALSQRTPLDPTDTHRETERTVAAQAPYAWAQLVLYHRGNNQPLSLKIPNDFGQQRETQLTRTYDGTDQRRRLTTGFIGRRHDLRRFRKAYRANKRVFIFQGLGGLGKSTLAFHALPILTRGDQMHTHTIWCAELEDEHNPAQALTQHISALGESLLGEGWLGVIQHVDQMGDLKPPQRFALFLSQLLNHLDKPLALYLDNLESLMVGPDNTDSNAIGDWIDNDIAQIINLLIYDSDTAITDLSFPPEASSQIQQSITNHLFLVASCRYRNDRLNDHTLAIKNLGNSALFRLMGWFKGLRQLASHNRAQLVGKLHGHPRAVEYLNDLIESTLKTWTNRYGEYALATTETAIQTEWDTLIAPVLPEVEDQLRENLLFDAIWANVLDEHARRMLFRMTVLRRPWDWDLMLQLGEPNASTEETETTIKHLRETSLLGELETWEDERWAKYFHIHPATARFVAEKTDNTEELYHDICLRIGNYLEELGKTSRELAIHLDAGHYLFLSSEYNRAGELLGPISAWFQKQGRVHEGLAILTPFEQTHVFNALLPDYQNRLLRTLGSAIHLLGRVQTALNYYNKSLTISRRTKNKQAEAQDLGNLGSAYSDFSQFDKAIEHYQQALAILQEIGDRQASGLIHGNLGLVYSRLKQVSKAIEHYQQALIISREVGNRWDETRILGYLGNAYLNLMQVDKAISHFEQALIIAREIGYKQEEGNCIGNLGLVYAGLGQVDPAIAYYQQALTIIKEIGDRHGEGNLLGNLGIAYANLGQVETAREYLEKSLAIAIEIIDPDLEHTVREKLKKL